jgi:hypothetical protein
MATFKLHQPPAAIHVAVLLAALASPAAGQQVLPPHLPEVDELHSERELLKQQFAASVKLFEHDYAFMMHAQPMYGVALLLDRELDVSATTDRPRIARLYLAAEKEGYTPRVASFGQALAGELVGIPNVVVISEQPLPDKLAALLAEYEKSGARVSFIGDKPPKPVRAAALDVSLAADDGQFARDLRAALGDRGHTLLVVKEGARSRLILSQWDGGRDAKYVLVQRDFRWPPGSPRPRGPIRVTLGYLPQVAGTDLLYEVTSETLQGKARPFVCDLGDRGCRIYAILPVQIEGIALAVRPQKDPALSVAFCDARGQRLQAALPFHVRVSDAAGQTVSEQFASTDREGRYDQPLKLPGDPIRGSYSVAVRSLLTGREATTLVRKPGAPQD